jgi:hypothetical protein
MPITPIVLVGSLVYAFIQFMKDLTNRNMNAVITQLSVWVAGVAAITLAAATDYADAVNIGDKTLADLSTWSLVFIGLLASSLFSVVHDVTRTIGNDGGTKLVP